MIKSENGCCEITGTLGIIKEDFRTFLKSIKYCNDREMLKSLIDVLKEELESAKDNSDN